MPDPPLRNLAKARSHGNRIDSLADNLGRLGRSVGFDCGSSADADTAVYVERALSLLALA